MKILLLVFLALAVTLSACVPQIPSGVIPVIGTDEYGNPTSVPIDVSEYSDRLSKALIDVQDSVIPVLNKRESRSGWMLRTIVFGIGLTTEIGIGPFKVGALPRSRLVFSNNVDPQFP